MALTPDVVPRLVKKGVEVLVEAGAGAGAFHPDEAYMAQGARMVSRQEAFAADVVVKVQPPTDQEIGLMKSGGALIAFLEPLDHPERARALAGAGITALSMEMVPRLSRAQKMDALSAMASVTGYKAVLLAAEALPKFFPLLTTAAGTVRPSNVLVLGAGVAGLQAIATARRLGGRVSAYDVREAVREEVQSLGANFVELEMEVSGMQDAGGYAKALEQDKQQRQAQLLEPHVAKADVVICTALVPGRRAPLLVTEAAVEGMAGGSVIVDLAAPNGGNCALTEPGQVAERRGVKIFGPLNLASEMPIHASQMYARTILAMVLEFTREGEFVTSFDDEIFRGACLTHQGEVVNERVKGLIGAA